MRILLDEEGLNIDESFDIIYKTFSYTNHTVLPEAFNINI
jgi:starch phosphorylase